MHVSLKARLNAWSRHPALTGVKRTIRQLQTGLDYSDFQQLKRLVATLPLASLLERQPFFTYKYLSPYVAASFDRRARLTILLHHYRFLSTTDKTWFFIQLARDPVLWQEQHGDDLFAIHLSYPLSVGFEAELSLNFYLNQVLIQVVSFVIVPGALVGLQTEGVLFFSQVQGVRNPALLKRATKTLNDITPAVLLVQAAYGLAQVLHLTCAAGIRSTDQLSSGTANTFDYDAFWSHLKGELSPDGHVYYLPIPTPEKPLHQVKSSKRARSTRKRAFKRQMREQVGRACQTMLRPI